ncbi:uncharacterized protein LOC142609072 [Castanea sativa]|uniref:uncharacterized protein LOC142609072 n=1 Tax=Castanea sativa TaxID=21020 RepID=UPI003F650D36
MLGAFDIKYQLRTSITGQVLADLVAEFSEDQTKEGVQDQEAVGVFAAEISLPWIVYTDGAANQKGSGVGVGVVFPDGIVLEKSLRLSFSATNNEAEYKALWSRLEAVKGLGGNSIKAFSDSQLIVEQVLGEYEAKDASLFGQDKQLQAHFQKFILKQVPWCRNSHADSLATLAIMSDGALPRLIIVEKLDKPRWKDQSLTMVHAIQAGPTWIDPIIAFLRSGDLPKDKADAEKIQRRATQYWLS